MATTKILSARIPASDRDALAALARSAGMTLTAYLLAVIQEEVRRSDAAARRRYEADILTREEPSEAIVKLAAALLEKLSPLEMRAALHDVRRTSSRVTPTGAAAPPS
ncbi:hypothetical protein [Parvularcula dongshanensis]|uniref:DUF1778 domain-containing protein n=1 Tax=Parvularcula dongshanensis TaxID=1173995 RepID=A0A840I6T7_9PROT|nr:hypothetical protein [Parvularcula dongshanensis]MBB4660192.1 hypothetical protein [Parvularcula dongshanensis]